MSIGQHNLRILNYSISGKNVTIDKVNVNQPLNVSAEKALKKTGSSRPLSDYDIYLGQQKLDGNNKVSSYDFAEDAVLLLSLKTGQGGY